MNHLRGYLAQRDENKLALVHLWMGNLKVLLLQLHTIIEKNSHTIP